MGKEEQRFKQKTPIWLPYFGEWNNTQQFPLLEQNTSVFQDQGPQEGKVTANYGTPGKAVPIFLEQSHIWRKHHGQHFIVLSCMRLLFPFQQCIILFNSHNKQLKSHNKCKSVWVCKSESHQKQPALSMHVPTPLLSNQTTAPLNAKTTAVIKLFFFF